MQSGNPACEHMIRNQHFSWLICKLLNLNYFELLIANDWLQMCYSLVSCWSILIPKGKLRASRRIPTTRITAPSENYTIYNELMGKRRWFVCLQFRTAGENSGSQITNANTQFERQFEIYNETINTV